MFEGKTILITGGTGSFGKNFIRYLLARYYFKKLIILSRDENKQFEMRKEFSDERLRFFLGDVRDRDRLQRAFSGVDIVVHAAALKQVPMLEYNPFEAVKTNILGSKNVIDAAIDQGVDRVILISTDKAVHPVNLYGSTKLCAEKLFVDGNVYSTKTKFSCVRYGNVFGSRGSIVESMFRNGAPQVVTITDERMTRFWITYEQACQLVEFALTYMAGGEIFVPKIPSMKILDLLMALAPQAEQNFVGIRPGEKLHEILLTPEESRHAIELDKYYMIYPEDREIFNIEKRFEYLIKQGRPVQPDFSFTSDKNTRWMGSIEIRQVFDQIST